MLKTALNISILLLGISIPSGFASNFDGENVLPVRECAPELFRRIFHDISSAPPSVTTRRKESRVAVTHTAADAFFSDVRGILGDFNQLNPKKRRLQLRDVPEDKATMFITDTDYVRNMIAVENGKEVHRARIRKRKYVVVPKNTTVEQLSKIPKDQWVYSRIADGDGLYAKLELKVGSPSEDPESHEFTGPDKDRVVDKPGIVMLDADIDTLLAGPESFRENREAILQRALAVTMTRDGKTVPVNHPEDTAEIFQRLGWIYQQNWLADEITPQTNMQYARKAYKVIFPVPGSEKGETFEVQITFDEDIVQRYFKSGNIERSFATDRVVELKIPEEYADLSTEELTAKGLGELAQIRDIYEKLTPLEDTRKNSGKRSNIGRRNISVPGNQDTP